MASEPGFVMQRAQPKAGPGIDPNRVKPEARQVRAKRTAVDINDAMRATGEPPPKQEVSDSSQAYSLVLRDLYERVAKLQVAIAAIEALQ